MTGLGKAAFAGVLNAAAAVFVATMAVLIWGDYNVFLIAPFISAIAVIVALPLIVPLGGALGALLPFVVRNCSSYRAFGRGFLVGILVGVIVTSLLAIRVYFSVRGYDSGVDPESRWSVIEKAVMWYSAILVPYSAIWVGIWAARWSKYVA